jgi:hypothetical protein
MMAVRYDVSVPRHKSAFEAHLRRSELEGMATIKKYLIVQNEGGRSLSKESGSFQNLPMPALFRADVPQAAFRAQIFGSKFNGGDTLPQR